MPVTIRLINKAAFYAKLKSTVPRIETELTKANAKSAEAMVDSAQRLVPVDPNDEDGIHLRDSIRAFKGSRAAYIVQAGGTMTTKPVRNGADQSYDYALAIEYGTQETTAQPYFWPAFRLNRKPMKARASRAIGKAIKDAGF